MFASEAAKGLVSFCIRNNTVLEDIHAGEVSLTDETNLPEPQAGSGSSFLERMMGVEPTLSAWEAGVLPINYIRTILKVCAYHIIIGNDFQ